MKALLFLACVLMLSACAPVHSKSSQAANTQGTPSNSITGSSQAITGLWQMGQNTIQSPGPWESSQSNFSFLGGDTCSCQTFFETDTQDMVGQYYVDQCVDTTNPGNTTACSNYNLMQGSFIISPFTVGIASSYALNLCNPSETQCYMFQRSR